MESPKVGLKIARRWKTSLVHQKAKLLARAQAMSTAKGNFPNRRTRNRAW